MVRVPQERARTYRRNASTSCSLLTLTRRKRNGLSHLKESEAAEFSNDLDGRCNVSEWLERSGAQLVETRASHCSLVVLDDTEARYLRPLLTVQPSFTISY